MLRITLLAAASLSLLAPAAQAHVTFEQSSAVAKSTYKAVLRVPHGCDGSPTTAITVFLPEGFNGAKPMPKAGWRLITQQEKLAQPYESHGKPVTERTARITWRGGRLLDSEYDEFIFRVSLPETPGKQWVRVLQQCVKGQTDWAAVPVAGQPRPAHPAASLDITPAPGNAATPAAAEFRLGNLRITQPWTRATPPGASAAGGYLKLDNTGATDRLVSASADIAAAVELHTMSMEGNVMKMQKLEQGIELPAGKSVELKPGGLHVMFIGLKAPLRQGEKFPLRLRFEKAGEVTVQVSVDAMTAGSASSTGAGSHNHSHHGH